MLFRSVTLSAEQEEFSGKLRRLVEFGEQAKVRFCSIEEAYKLAQSIPCVSLEACCGNESGVVGALAGVGLRLGGNDGRFRGKNCLSFLEHLEESLTVGAAVRGLKTRVAGPVLAITVEGLPLDHATPLSFHEEAKPVLMDAAMTLVCSLVGGIAYPCTKDDLSDETRKQNALLKVCDEFEWDNDSEECIDKARSCRNCLFRRWMTDGFKCLRDACVVNQQVSLRG